MHHSCNIKIIGLTVWLFSVMSQLGLAQEEQPAPKVADPAEKYRLDTTRFMFSQVEPDSRIRSEDRNPDEYRAYNYVLMHADSFPTSELLEHARRDVTFRDLLSEHREEFQFQLIRFEGRLKRMKRIEATAELKDAGIEFLYEAWVFPLLGTEPICIVVTEPPAGLEPESIYQPAKVVTIPGYYFKALRYDAEERVEGEPQKNVVRRAPLLLGHSFELHPEPQGVDSSVDLMVILAIIAGILVVVFAYIWWVRKGDREIKNEVRAQLAPNPFDDSQS